MIHDSSPWKTALLLDADLIERWALTPRPSERRSILVERKVFLAAYAMRKLDDGAKLSSETLANPIQVSRFPLLRDGYAPINSHRYEKFFDLERPQRETIRRRALLDLLIHSLVFVEVLGETGTLDGFMVTSDKDHVNGLVEVKISSFIELMRLAARDYPSVIRHTRDHKGRWKTKTGHEGQPKRS